MFAKELPLSHKEGAVRPPTICHFHSKCLSEDSKSHLRSPQNMLQILQDTLTNDALVRSQRKRKRSLHKVNRGNPPLSNLPGKKFDLLRFSLSKAMRTRGGGVRENPTRKGMELQNSLFKLA